MKLEAAGSNNRNVVGEYYFGDGSGVNCTLNLNAIGRFTFEWRGCLGIYDKNNGGFNLDSGVLKLKPEEPNIQKGFRGTSTTFYPIRWGSRLYLVPTDKIIEFCSEVNQGGEPRHSKRGQYYLRRNDWEKPVTGKPVVPDKWLMFLLDKPVIGKITDLIGKQEAWLDVGTESGLLQGMILTAHNRNNLMFTQVRVDLAEKSRCRIKCEWSDDQLEVGQTVSSRFHDN